MQHTPKESDLNLIKRWQEFQSIRKYASAQHRQQLKHDFPYSHHSSKISISEEEVKVGGARFCFIHRDQKWVTKYSGIETAGVIHLFL
eukprot:7168436-Ditylum_brightwellii.AAC.1